MLNKKERHALRRYEANKSYVEKNIDQMSWQECLAMAKTQTDLYKRAYSRIDKELLSRNP